MYVVIDSECTVIPERAKSLTSEGEVLLNLLLSLGYDPADPPIADLLRQYYKLDGAWLILSPIHWQATHNDAMIIALGKELQLQEAEMRSWFNLFSEHLAAENKGLYYHNAEIWLLCNDKNTPINAKPVRHLLNQSLMSELVALDNTMYWQKFITESQMFFASTLKQSMLNGVWIWGGAKLKNKKAIKICADSCFLPIAQICSSNVTLYSPSVSLSEHQVLLLSEFSMLSEQHQKELKKISAHWYWNNTAYTLCHDNWFMGLWRKIIHAY